MSATEPIRNKQHIRQLADYFLKKGQLRNHLLIALGIGTALRISDLLSLRWEDVYDFQKKRIRKNVTIIEKKTGKCKTIAINKDVSCAISRYSPQAAREGAYLIENPRTKNAISRVQAYRIIRGAAEALELECPVSCHSLRKTFGYHAWKRGVSPVVIMEIYNHSSFSVTRRYLGVCQDDKDEVYLNQHLLA